MRRVKRIRSGKRKIRDCEAGFDRAEAEAHLGSPSFHQSRTSSDDLFGEDEIESVRPGHVEALGAAYRSLESEGGVIGAAAFGAKRGRMPSAKIAIAQLYGWSSSGGFAEATCLEAEPGRGQLRITEDLVGGPHGGIVHFCATDVKVCKVGWPGRRVYHVDVWRPFTITGNGSEAQKGVKNHEVVSVVPPAAQANILEEDVDSPGPGPQPVSGKPKELQQKLEDIKSRLGGLGSLPRVQGRRVRLQSDESLSLSRRQHRGLADLLPRIQSKVDGSSQSAGRVTSTDLLPGVVEWQSDYKFKCGDDLRRHDGAGSDDFFEPELFHEASPRFEPVGTFTQVAGPLAGGSPLVHEELPCAPGRGRCFRPAASLGLPGNGFQPGVTYESGDEDNCRARRCSCGGGRSPSWRSSDSAVQGSRNFRHRRHLVVGSTSRAYSRERCRACLCGRASGHFAVGAPAAEAHGGGQQEIGNRQRGASRVKFGGAPCESSSQGSQKYPARPRGEAEKAQIGCTV